MSEPKLDFIVIEDSNSRPLKGTIVTRHADAPAKIGGVLKTAGDVPLNAVCKLWRNSGEPNWYAVERRERNEVRLLVTVRGELTDVTPESAKLMVERELVEFNCTVEVLP